MGKKIDDNVMNYKFYTVDDVAAILGVSRPKAYAVMRELNRELLEKGYIVVSGKVSAKYFNEKLYIKAI